MKSKDLIALEKLLAAIKNDSLVATQNEDLRQEELQILKEISENEEKVDLLLDNPNDENLDAVVGYFEKISQIASE